MIHSVFELGDTIVREVMVPRPDMVVIERGKTLRQAMSLALRSGFSRIPVVGESVDDVVGFVYLKDVVRRIHDYREAERGEHVEDVMRPATFVPDSKPVDELLREMQAQRIHAVVVVDEYGGTAGLVTIEDILEEIVGEIADEYDTGRPEIEELPDGDVRVSARLHVDDLVEHFDLEVADAELEDVDSVGGLLAELLGKVPIAGSQATFHGLQLRAESLSGRRNRIGTVLVHRLDAAAANGTAPGAGRRPCRSPCRRPCRRRRVGPPGARPVADARSSRPAPSSTPRTPSWSRSPGPAGPGPAPPRVPRCATRPAARTPPRRSRCRPCGCPRCRPPS